jgi:hypothetical protein
VEVEFFDAGCSRQVPWSSRPAAAALLAELSSQERRFDAVVVGEYERAFSGDEFAPVRALFERAGVQMWLPEAGGRWEREDPVAQALVMVLGAQSQREVLRIAASGTGGDASTGLGAGPVPRWAAAVRLSPGRWRSASEPGACALGTAAAAVGTGPGDRAARAVDVRAAVGRTQYRGHRARADRARRAVPVSSIRSGTGTATVERGRCAPSRRS